VTDWPPESVEQAYEACAAITRRCARNFYYGLKLTPEPRRSALYAMYAWMRCGDDCVDEGESRAAKELALDQFRQRTQTAMRGSPVETEDAPAAAMWAAFGDAVHRFGVRAIDITAMLAGLEEDLLHAGYETEDELERYCRCVASSVGSVCVTIWGLRAGIDESDAMERAAQRGIAFQLTNILRDFAEDFDMRRIYVPGEAFDRFEVTAADLRRWDPADRCGALMADRIAQAELAYERSAGLETMIDAACVPSLWAMTRIYRGLLDKIKADPERIVHGARIRLASYQKAGIAFRAFVKGRRAGATV